MNKIIPVILCGGSGTRLWPLSRKSFAKQHVPILKGESPFQRTLRRIDDAGLFARPIVIGGAAGRFMVADQAAEIGVEIDIVIEPAARDTAAAVAAGAALAAQRDGDAVALVLPSDHLIPDIEAFAEMARRGAEAARKTGLVVFGLTPTHPATGFGYIEPGAARDAARQVARFAEKPDEARARELIAQGCLWNSGMFCFEAQAGLAEMRRLAPEIVEAAEQAVAQGADDLGALRLGAAFESAPAISFDYAILEKTDNCVVVDASLAWSDVGDWREIWSQSEKDADGVAIEGDALTLNSRDSYVRASEGRLVCALGVENMAIVDTPDALLVAPLDRTQEVKALVGELTRRGRSEATTPARCYRPWGWYQTMDLGDRFRVKRIQVTPGKKLSLQRHHHRAEHWVVVRGTAEVTRDEETFLVRENESVYLPLGCVHRLANPGMIPVEIIEVQTGAYLEEDDIIRIEDDFGRG